MVYIYYGLSYKENYCKGLAFAYNISKNPIIINENIINYNKEDMESFLYQFSINASENDPVVIIIEKPENIKDTVMQLFLIRFENLSPYQTIILITNQIQKLKKTIISRSFLILNKEKNEKEEQYEKFIHNLQHESLCSQSLEEIIDKHAINDENTQDASIILLQKYPHLKNEIKSIQKKYLSFVKNSYYGYWKMIYLLIHQN